jgi:hypothetical protein
VRTRSASRSASSRNGDLRSAGLSPEDSKSSPIEMPSTKRPRFCRRGRSGSFRDGCERYESWLPP